MQSVTPLFFTQVPATQSGAYPKRPMTGMLTSFFDHSMNDILGHQPGKNRWFANGIRRKIQEDKAGGTDHHRLRGDALWLYHDVKSPYPRYPEHAGVLQRAIHWIIPSETRNPADLTRCVMVSGFVRTLEKVFPRRPGPAGMGEGGLAPTPRSRCNQLSGNDPAWEYSPGHRRTPPRPR